MKRKFELLSVLFCVIASIEAVAQGADNGAERYLSESFKKGIPVHITNNRNNGYAIKLNNAAAGQPVNSGNAAYEKSEIWYLVGNSDEFKMFSHAAGRKHALKLTGTGSGSEAVMAPADEATLLALKRHEDGSFTISPKDNPGMSFNMFGGAGRDIRLYMSEDEGGRWNIRTVDTSRSLKLRYKAILEGGFDTNYKIGSISLIIDGNRSEIMLDKRNIPEAGEYFLPDSCKFSVEPSKAFHGWNIEIADSPGERSLPKNGTEITVNISVDKNNKYQYLYYSPDEKGVPYRIPAIVTTANGYVFAINDYRPCGNDIGFGEVDLVMRHSAAAGKAWDGHSWTEPVKIADGLGNAATEIWKVGFGDPAVVADREKNEILVMSVCGNRVCWHGNYGAGTKENPENPNRMARLRIKFNETTGIWEATQPKEVTYEIYPLFKDKNGKAHVGSMFIGAGRMAQSSMIKVGEYYRIYCAVWAVETGSYRHHNYALYSDDFGETWHLLGELGNDYNDSPAPLGNEPKCEELPDGSVLLSSRKGNGRYYNVFHYTNFERAEGYWDGAVATDKVEDPGCCTVASKFGQGTLKFGDNDTNGEILRIGNILFQSVPTGNRRSDVAVFYKHLSDDPATYTPTELSKGWRKIEITDKESAYSSMCILPDGKSIGLYYEEEPGGYSMVYVPVELENSIAAAVYWNGMRRCPFCDND